MIPYEYKKIQGILLLDKPKGITSNDVVKKIKSIFFLNKVGHTGSLDPIATGMLPICIGKATKLSQFLLNSNKVYEVEACFGVSTSTYDADGIIVCKRMVNFTHDQFLNSLNKFNGKICQLPPMYSAIKCNGIPLYKYARKGLTVFRKFRKVNISKILFLKKNKNFIFFKIHCSKGTYIRTIIHDLGEYLGCGAHVVSLRRLKVSSYSSSNLISLDFLKKPINNTGIYINNMRKKLIKLLLPSNSIVSFLPEVNLSYNQSLKLKYGQIINYSSNHNQGLVRLTEGNKKIFFGIAIYNIKGFLIPKCIIDITI
ncbi:tRNA pseudouridine synthase B [Buchnera aphidicola (Neophyllaphis podocarpi)]|uniref:tRNA pseudouridine(55) synthase TruB n=1 Tax=Buchnera aphidicola TaxID=9 RepID=UPI0034644733